MRTVLLIAYHYPPVQGSSGLQRTLRFSEHLLRHGWRPIVLSIDTRAYEALLPGGTAATPAGVVVIRTLGLDAARHFGLFGRYPRFLANPDRWCTWRFSAVSAAKKIIRENDVDAVWSTFPIATAHQIGLQVARKTGVPWIAEFRDPMWQGDYPPDPVINKSWLKLEQEIFENASAVVVTTPSALKMYRERYPDFTASNVCLIENGFDEGSFQQAEATPAPEPGPRQPVAGPLKLLHSGVIYPSERDPTQLFSAIAALKASDAVQSKDLQLLLRASGNERQLAGSIDRLGIGDIVKLAPPIDYVSALREMLAADGLLILQAANCNAQIPAKIYEYFRARKPILALTDAAGDTAQTLRDADAGVVAPLDSQAPIEAAILRFMAELRSDRWYSLRTRDVTRYSRAAQTGQLTDLLNAISTSAVRRAL